MKLILGMVILLSTMAATAHDQVWCDHYANGNAVGYSLYRASDRKDIGNAVWPSDFAECDAAAQMANYVQAGITCARYFNSVTQTTLYSVYRISDNKDLGKTTISSFESCNMAVRYARRGIFCSTYLHEGVTWWSPYDIATGVDLGTKLYSSLESCEQSY